MNNKKNDICLYDSVFCWCINVTVVHELSIIKPSMIL